MLALVFTLAFALYILGPDLFSRFLLGFTIPRRSVNLTRSEEVTRAIIWAAITIVPAVAWAHWFGTLGHLWSAANLKTFYAGLYSESFFKDHQTLWFESLVNVAWLNFAILWRTYTITLLISGILTVATHRYAAMRRSLHNWPRIRATLASIVLPRIAPWHLLLSRLLLDEDHLSIHLDVLTKSDGLYQGRLADKVLAADGSLLSLTLAEPKRFRREEYMHHKLKGSKPEPTEFWKPIPTNMFLIVGAEIQTINFRYVPESVAGLRQTRSSDDLKEVMSALSQAVEALKAAQSSNAPSRKSSGIKKANLKS